MNKAGVKVVDKILLAVCLLFCQPCFAQTLKAGIEIDDNGYRQNYVAPLAVGQPFTPEQLPKSSAAIYEQIPPWLSGLWRFSYGAVIPNNDPVRGQQFHQEFERVIGGYFDKKHHEWSRFDYPRITPGRYLAPEEFYEISYPSDYQQTKDSCQMREENTVIHVVHGRITAIDHCTASVQFKMTGTVLVVTNIRDDDPTTKINQFSLRHTTVPEPLFTTMQSFHDYLTSHGEAKLAP